MHSGSTLTTFANNIANFYLGLSIYNGTHAGMTKQEVVDIIPRLCGELGYKVTVEVCDVIEDVQFLKHSPVYTVDGKISAALNLGVILRTLGQTDGELTMSPEHFLSGIINGFKHAGNSTLMRVLRKHVISTKVIAKHYLIAHSSGREGLLDDNSLVRRYRLSLDEYHDLCSILDSAGIGDVIRTEASIKIMKRDYGYD